MRWEPGVGFSAATVGVVEHSVVLSTGGPVFERLEGRQMAAERDLFVE